MLFTAEGLLLPEEEKRLLGLERDEPFTGGQLPYLRAIIRQALDRAIAYETVGINTANERMLLYDVYPETDNTTLASTTASTLASMLAKYEVISQAE